MTDERQRWRDARLGAAVRKALAWHRTEPQHELIRQQAACSEAGVTGPAMTRLLNAIADALQKEQS